MARNEIHRIRRMAAAFVIAAVVLSVSVPAFAQFSSGPTPQANGAMLPVSPDRLPLNEADATALFRADGYTDISPLTRDGNFLIGHAIRDGQAAQVRINVNNAQIE